MKIPLLPVHVVTTKTLNTMVKEMLDNCDGLAKLAAGGEKAYQLTLKELANLINRSIALERIAARYGHHLKNL